MEHYHGYYILHDYERDCYIIDTEGCGFRPTWDVFKATRFDTIDDALDWKVQIEEDGYCLEILFVEVNIKEVKD